MIEPVVHKLTTTALLESLKNPGQDTVWREFDARYRPVLFAFARKLGLAPADAEEVAQATLVEFTAAYREGRYDRTKGRLSSWIIGIARNQIGTRWRAQGQVAGNRGDSVLGHLHDDTDMADLWVIEQQRVILARAWQALRTSGRTSGETLQAFELVAMRGLPASTVAAECGMTLEEVYIAKSRVSKRLREVVNELTIAYGEDP